MNDTVHVISIYCTDLHHLGALFFLLHVSMLSIASWTRKSTLLWVQVQVVETLASIKTVSEFLSVFSRHFKTVRPKEEHLEPAWCPYCTLLYFLILIVMLNFDTFFIIFTNILLYAVTSMSQVQGGLWH